MGVCIRIQRGRGKSREKFDGRLGILVGAGHVLAGPKVRPEKKFSGDLALALKAAREASARWIGAEARAP